MKTRIGFISNSSSTSFIIKNLSNSKKTLINFVEENPQLIDQYNSQYNGSITLVEMLISAFENNEYWDALEEKELVFGDESGTIIGNVFDYILRDGGKSTNFKWSYSSSLR